MLTILHPCSYIMGEYHVAVEVSLDLGFMKVRVGINPSHLVNSSLLVHNIRYFDRMTWFDTQPYPPEDMGVLLQVNDVVRAVQA